MIVMIIDNYWWWEAVKELGCRKGGRGRRRLSDLVLFGLSWYQEDRTGRLYAFERKLLMNVPVNV